MARNYSIGEAAQILVEGTDHEAIMDMGRRYPLLVAKASKVAALAGESFADFMSFMPEYLSANKVNSSMKKNLLTEDGDTDKPAKKKAESKVAKKAEKKATKKSDDTDYASMKGKELNALIDEVGGRKKCMKEFGDCKNGSMIKYLEKHYPNGVDADAGDDDEGEASGYEDMTPDELYKLCKKKGIKAAPKKKADYYINLLEEAEDADEEDDDWEDVEEEEKPKKATKKAPAKKAAKKAEPEDDVDDDEDDDDWDI